MEIRILSNTEAELWQVASWIYNEWGYLDPNNSVEGLSKVLSQRCDRQRIPLTLVATEDGELVGTVSLVENEFKRQPELTPFLSSLFVPSVHRHKGIGQALCREANRIAVELSYAKCFLVTDKGQKFYERIGWQTILEYSYRDGSAFLMTILL